jgi:hypothetical protein
VVSRQSPPGAVGYIIYTGDGHMAFQLMRSRQPAFVAGNIAAGTPEEKLGAFDNFIAYCGSYELRGSNTVVHHVEASSFPNIVGTDFVRTFTLSGNELTVTTPLATVATATREITTLTFERT